MFFGGILLSYLLVTPRVYDYPEGSDFSTFYTAGKIVRRGQSQRLYDWALQTRVQSEFSRATVLRGRALPYLRPPFEALLFVPLSYLPYRTAFGVWIALCGLFVGLSAMFLRSRIPDAPAIPWWLYYPAIFSFGPIAHGFALGQDCALVLFLFAWILICLHEGKDFRAGCLLGLALIKFQLVLPLLFVFMVKKQFRTLAGFSSVAALLAAVGVWLLGWEGILGYATYLWQLNQRPLAAGIWPSMMPSIRGLAQGWGDMHSSVGLDLLVGMLSFVLLIWAAMQWDTTAPRRSRCYRVGISICFFATLLAGYHASGYDMSLLFPVVLYAANSGWYDRELDVRTRGILLLGSALLLCAPLYLVLARHGQVNLLAVAVLVLVWGYSRTIRVGLPESAVVPALPSKFKKKK